MSCIYSLGDPIDYRSMVISLRPGMQMERDELCSRLVKLQYERNDMNFIRNKFRVKGDTVDIHLPTTTNLRFGSSSLATRLTALWSLTR